jgi:proline dehydrogenase
MDKTFDPEIFQNTQVAFERLSDLELRRGYYLLKMLKYPGLVKLGKNLLNFAIAIHFPINWAVRPTIYKHFVGGETLEQCLPLVRQLEKYNVKAVLDFSVEGSEDEEKIKIAFNETKKTILNAAKDPNVPFAVYKPSAFGSPHVLSKVSANEPLNDNEKKIFENFKNYVFELSQTAYENNVPIMIDAEYYSYQNAVDQVILEMMRTFNKEKPIVYNTLQMYRKDRLDYLKWLYQTAQKEHFKVGIKFVRGAYMEIERELAKKHGYPDPIHPTKQDTDNAYNQALKFSVEHIDTIAIFNATHNEYSNVYLMQLMDQHNIDKTDNRCFFAQLYGMSDHITFNLAKLGYNVAKYIPYGPIKVVLPYLIRRMEENTSVAGQTPRELALYEKEFKRRRKMRKAKK